MSDINFCNTKEQLNHLGEVVTGKVDGSPTGADIDTSTLPYTGQVRKTLPALEGEYEQSITDKEAEADAAIDAYRLLSKGPYAAGITLESKFEYITYNGESYFAVNPPYTTTATTPDADGNLLVGNYITDQRANITAIARSLNIGESQVIHSTDTSTVLDDVLYIYDASTQTTWGKPVSVGSGETIVSVDGSTLTTSAGVRILTSLTSRQVPITVLQKLNRISHRGQWKAFPENTTLTVVNSPSGKDAIEMDFQVSADGHWVSIHDLTVDATTDGTGTVISKTLAELKSLDAGSWFDARYEGTKIPTIDEVASAVAWKGSQVLVVEIKAVAPTDTDLQVLIGRCRQILGYDRFVLAAFDYDILLRCRRFSEEVLLWQFIPTIGDINIPALQLIQPVVAGLQGSIVDEFQANQMRNAGLYTISTTSITTTNTRNWVKAGIAGIMGDTLEGTLS